MRSSKQDVKHMSNLIKHQNSQIEMTTMITYKANDHPNMHSMEHNNIGIYACPKQKHDAMRTTKHNSKHHKANKKTNRTKFSYDLNVFSPLVYASPL